MRLAIYLRVSTDDQAESGNGINAQRDACHAYASRTNSIVLGIFADEGVSGAAPLDKRPGMMDALGALGPGDALLVAKRDRLGRDPVIVAMIEAAANRRKARVISTAGEGTDGDAPTDVLMRRIVDGFAEYERLIIKARTKAALGAKKRRGERVGTIPLGSDLADPSDDGRLSKSGLPVALVANADELAVLALIRDLLGSGLSCRAVARELTRRGIPTKAGGRSWSESTIRGLRPRLAELPPAEPPTTSVTEAVDPPEGVPTVNTPTMAMTATVEGSPSQAWMHHPPDGVPIPHVPITTEESPHHVGDEDPQSTPCPPIPVHVLG